MSANRSSGLIFKKYIVDVKDFKILQKINSGGFGSVYSVQNIKTGDTLAAKVLSSNKEESLYKKMITREIGIMIRCQHPTIIKFYGYSLKDFHDEKNATIFMELFHKGSLAELLSKVKNGLLDIMYDNTNRQIILIGVARGMMYLHQHQIIHRDLKPGNILLDEDLHPHITDFGLSKVYDTGQSNDQSQQCGTSVYMAPEIVEGTQYNGKADVYAFGILMYEVITDLVPFPLYQSGKMKPLQFSNKVVYENYRPSFDVPIKNSLQNLIEKCWSKDPKERPTFDELFKKLAYNIEDSFDDIYNNQEGEEDENENKYYLDDVSVDDVLMYADDIDNLNSPPKEDISSKIESLIKPLMEQNEELKKQINESNKKNKKLKKKIDDVLKDNKEMKEQISQMEINKKQIDDVLKDNKEMKEQLSEMEQTLMQTVKIKDFNSLPLKTQQSITSNLANGNTFLSNVNDLLLYIHKLNIDHSSICFKIASTDEDKLITEENKEKKIRLNSNVTESIFNNNSIQSEDFKVIMSNFKSLIIEVKYPSGSFTSICNSFLSFKNKANIDVETEILLTNLDKQDAFKKNSQFKIFKIDSTITKIHGFTNSAYLTQIIIPSSVTLIEEYAFKDCTLLKQITIPESVTKIDKGAFLNCISLSQLSIPSSITEINESTFEGCTSLIQISIPDSVKKIYRSAFLNCKSLTHVSIPSSITEISESTFEGCISLIHISLPDSLIRIGINAFCNCKSLIHFEIPYSVDIIEEYAFKNCFSLSCISIPPFISYFDKCSLENCVSLVQIVSLPQPRPIYVKIIDISNQIYGCLSLKQIVIPGKLDDELFINNITDYQITEFVGGIYANVFKVMDSKQNKFILKTYPFDILPLPGIARTLKYRLPSPGKSSIEIKTKQEILKTFDLSGYALITEYYENGDISTITSDYLSSKGAKNDKMNPTIRCKIIFGVAATMKRLHKKNIVHCDLSHANILLDDKLEPRIGGFALAKYVTSNTRMIKSVGTPLYMAPELFDDDYETYGLPVDVYSYGMVVYMLFTDKIVFPNNKNVRSSQQLKMRITRGERLVRPELIPDVYWELIQNCWCQDFEDRLTFEEITNALRSDEFALEEFGMKTDLDQLHEYQNRIDPD